MLLFEMSLISIVRILSLALILLFLIIHVTCENDINNQITSNSKLISEPKCTKVRKWCNDLDKDDDLHVLECLQSVNTKDITSLNKECQQIIWNHTDKIIEDANVKNILSIPCGKDIEQYSCSITSEKGTYFACILDNREDIKNSECLNEIQTLESVAFFDLRWVTQFLQLCNNDMEKLQCNTQESNRNLIFQGQSLGCLQSGIKTLEPRCKKQVFKLTEIQADNIKLDPELYSACAADRIRFCHEFQPGTGLVFKCLMQHRTDKMTVKCKEQLLKRQSLVVQDFKISKGLMRACREDIKKSHCRKQISDDKTIRLAQILLCLENYVHNGTKVSSSCEGEMIDQRKILMEDYRLSPEIVDGCKNDILKLCDTAVTGRTIHCLMEHARPRNRDLRITDVCQRALEGLLKETDAGEDWRVDPVLREACQPVVDRACRGLRGGDARVMSCLMNNLGTDFMTEACENALVQIQYFIARDFNLDPLLYRSCKEDAVSKCHAKNSWAIDRNNNNPDNVPLIFPCLYRYAYHEDSNLRLKPLCFEQIHRVMRQRALSVDLLPEIEGKCLDDLSLYCFDKIAKGEEIQCLQTHLMDLKEQCRLSVANFTEEQAQHVELNPVIMAHCRTIIDRHCKEKKDEGDVMECLITHKNDPDMRSDSKCRAAVEHFQLISLKNYHFSYKFKLACKPYVMRYCQSSRTKSDVIACLSETVRNDTLLGIRNRILKECRQQIRAQLYQQRESIQFDPKLRDACQKDIELICNGVDTTSSQALECLKTTVKKLSDKCQRQIFKIHTQDMIDNSIDYTLVTMCHDTIKQFCDTAEPATILNCLKHYKDEPNFDKKCKHVVIHRLIEQSKDYRFNPKLQEACNDEIGKFCSDILKEQKPDQELEGKVTECLKKQFRKSNLNSPCEAEMSELLREQALNYQLNPLLKSMCAIELETICKPDVKTDDASGQTEECLKNAFLNKQPMSRHCKNEVATLIEESEADIHVDPLLQKACTVDLLRYCGSVTQGGGKQLKCLEVTMSELSKPMEPECKNMLSKRIEMFKNAALVNPPDDFEQLYAQVAASPAKRYFMIVAITGVGFIFIVGLFCGRVTRRARSSKNK